jgi:TATA-box binding protein (TBP) (component of TFIID and TFIIIB)
MNLACISQDRIINFKTKIHNIVATFDLKKSIDFGDVIERKKVIYEPDQFPGIIYKTTHGMTCLTFASGNVVIAGAVCSVIAGVLLYDLFDLLAFKARILGP